MRCAFAMPCTCAQHMGNLPYPGASASQRLRALRFVKQIRRKTQMSDICIISKVVGAYSRKKSIKCTSFMLETSVRIN